MRNRRSRKLIHGTNLRIMVLIIIFVLMTGTIVHRLFDLQIIRGETYLNSFAMSIKKTRVLPSTRGQIYDCDGDLLAYNKLSYVVVFEDRGSYESNHLRNLTLNSILYRTIKIIESHGDSITTNFKVALTEDGDFVYTSSGFTLSRFKADLFGQAYIDDLTPEQKDISAPELIELLCTTKYFGLIDERTTVREKAAFQLPEEFTREEILQLCALRAELAANNFQRYNTITVARNVCEETVAQLLENSAELAGIDVVEDYLRIYNDAEYFSQIIGYTGNISGEELKDLREVDKTYDANDIVGKVGLEQVMETSLHGDKGSETIYVDNLGRTLSTESRTEPQAGNSLYLTIDRDLQIAAYQILERYIAGILWQNIVDTDSINTEWITSSDDVRIPVYDVYFSLFENNVLDVKHLSSREASANERHVYELFQKKAGDIFAEIKDQLIRSDPTPYKELTEEMQVYQSYIVNDMLTRTGILNADAIDESDLTWIAWSKDESIGLQEFLTYAISKNWIDINGITEDTSYMDSDEIYSALADYIEAYLMDDTDFCKRVFRYMLKEGSLSGSEVCLLLYDQGILEMDTDMYDILSDGTIGAYDFIREKIYNLELTPAQLALTPCSGSIVITDPASGDVKCCVSYPGYDSNRLVNEMDSAYYNKLVTDLSSPFYSRATQEVLAPGSTFKIVSATAGVMENVIAVDEGVGCTGLFEEVDPPVKCWVNPGAHGYEVLQTAIRDSCNYYFNTIGFRLSFVNGTYQDELGIEQLQKYAAMYGLDGKSGVEVPETAPHLADYDAVRAAMGQSNHSFTVTQLAKYVNTIANSGNCYDLTLIKRVTDSNGNIIDSKEPVLHSTVDLPDYLWGAIHGGMRAMAQQHDVFRDYRTVAVAGKTGTAQETTLRPTHALFIGYAPFNNPEMTITVRIANGYSSSNAAAAAKDAISYYFGKEEETALVSKTAVTNITTNNSTQD